MESILTFSKDVFSSGQVGSKMWLCHQLEKKLRFHQKHEGKGYVVWIYGGWVGLLSFLLFSRQQTPIQRIVNFDKNEKDLKASILLNEYWNWKGSYRAIHEDISKVGFSDLMSKYEEAEPHIVINTSIEHMKDSFWFDSLPPKKLVAIQSTDMKAEDHIRRHSTLEDLEKDFPLSDILFRDTLHFDYHNDSSFKRFMNIGFK